MVLLLLLILAGPNHIGPALMISTEENFPNSSSCLCSNLKIQLERDCMKVSKRTQQNNNRNILHKTFFDGYKHCKPLEWIITMFVWYWHCQHSGKKIELIFFLFPLFSLLPPRKKTRKRFHFCRLDQRPFSWVWVPRLQRKSLRRIKLGRIKLLLKKSNFPHISWNGRISLIFWED